MAELQSSRWNPLQSDYTKAAVNNIKTNVGKQLNSINAVAFYNKMQSYAKNDNNKSSQSDTATRISESTNQKNAISFKESMLKINDSVGISNDLLKQSLTAQLQTNSILNTMISKLDNLKSTSPDIPVPIGGKGKPGTKFGAMPKIGGALALGGAGMSAYDEYSTSGSIGRAGATGVGSLGGGLAGAWAGAKLGALGGTFVLPGIGTIIGGGLGMIGGGFAGSWAGEKAGKSAYDRLSTPSSPAPLDSKSISEIKNDKPEDKQQIVYSTNSVIFNTKEFKINGIDISSILGRNSNSNVPATTQQSGGVTPQNGAVSNQIAPNSFSNGNGVATPNSVPGQTNPNFGPARRENSPYVSSGQPRGAPGGLGGTNSVAEFVDPRTNPNVNQDVLKRYEGKQLPVVIRNNNPAALSLMNPGSGREFAERQPGYVGATARPANEGGYYAKYATPEHGIAANARLLERYGQKGINTTDAIVRKWSTDTKAHAAYSKRLQDALGVDGSTPIDLNDKNIQMKILMAKSAHESGAGKPIYTEDTFKRGVNREFEDGKPKSNGDYGSLKTGQNLREYGLNEGTKDALKNLGHSGTSYRITSGYRTPEANARAGGANNSQHLHGNAADISTKGMTSEQYFKAMRDAADSGFTRFGLSNTHGHLDRGGKKGTFSVFSEGPSSMYGKSMQQIQEEMDAYIKSKEHEDNKKAIAARRAEANKKIAEQKEDAAKKMSDTVDSKKDGFGSLELKPLTPSEKYEGGPFLSARGRKQESVSSRIQEQPNTMGEDLKSAGDELAAKRSETKVVAVTEPSRGSIKDSYDDTSSAKDTNEKKPADAAPSRESLKEYFYDWAI